MAGPGMLSLSRTEKYCTKLADEVVKLRSEKALMDFKIHVKDDIFPCAKFVMAAHSPMLRAMLTSDMTEVAKQEIRLDHISKDIVQIVLDYMYCEDVSFHKDQLMALIAAADYLQMAELKAMCLDKVPDILEPGNVITWWKEAAKMNYDTITELCEEIMMANVKPISHQTDFLNLDLNEIQHYVSDICSDNLNSDHTVDGLMRWVSHEDERVTYLEDLLNKIQLNKCSAEGLKNAMDSYESVLDKTPMAYKLLSKTLANIAIDTSETVSDIIVVVGGLEGDKVSPVCWKINQSNEVVHFCDIPDGDIAACFSVCKTPQGFIITGGVRSRLCMMFVAVTKSWIQLQKMLTVRRGHGSICIKEILYVFGGFLGQNSKSSASVQSIVLKNSDWKNASEMPLAVKLPKVSSIDDIVYLLDAETSKKLLCLNVDEGTWSELAPIPVKKDCCGVGITSTQGCLFVAGGRSSICAWYNPKSNTWCTGQQPLYQHKYGALAYHKKLLLIGGSVFNGSDDVEEYDIEEDKWSVCSYKMPRKIYNHYAVVLNIQPRD